MLMCISNVSNLGFTTLGGRVLGFTIGCDARSLYAMLVVDPGCGHAGHCQLLRLADELIMVQHHTLCRAMLSSRITNASLLLPHRLKISEFGRTTRTPQC
jgi:hypothetical protein